MKHKYTRRFYIGLAALLLACTLIIAASSQILRGAGEYMTIPDIASKINETYGYYGSALSQRTYHFKREIYRRIKPEVTALGSSRVLQFRGENFSAPFANIGGMETLHEVDEIARAIVAEHPPKIMIIGADFWWFNPANEDAAIPRTPEELSIGLADLLLPAGKLASGKMSPRQAQNIMTGDIPHVGITAILRRDGFDRFGAYHDTSLWLGERENDDAKFTTTRKRIENGGSIFVHGDSVSNASIAKFAALLDYLQEENIKPVIILPPLAPTAIDEMEDSGKYTYIPLVHERLRALAKERKIPFFNYHDLRSIGANDCEFTDGIHGGQTAYARILLRLAIENEDLRKTIRLPETARDIKQGEGKASLLAGETDFLNLGCKKTH